LNRIELMTASSLDASNAIIRTEYAGKSAANNLKRTGAPCGHFINAQQTSGTGAVHRWGDGILQNSNKIPFAQTGHLYYRECSRDLAFCRKSAHARFLRDSLRCPETAGPVGSLLGLPDGQRLGQIPILALARPISFDLLNHPKERSHEALTPRGNGAVIAQLPVA